MKRIFLIFLPCALVAYALAAPRPASRPRVTPGNAKRLRATTGPALKENTLNSYHAKRMSAPLAIDADWSKPAWKDIAPLTLEYYMGDEPAHQPKVQAKIAYDDKAVYVIWRVEDQYVLARRTKHQQPVCLDSCVEFFFTPAAGDPRPVGYFNLETSCSGIMWFSANFRDRKGGQLPPEDLAQVTIASSLKGPIDPEIAKPTTWTLEYKIPISLLQKYAEVARPAPGVAWRANFYKCADETSHPHWLTWSPVTWVAPAFHIPKFFGELVFD